MLNPIPIKNFSGVPDAWDYIPYADAYYQVIKQATIEIYGKNATLLDATIAMRSYGNVIFFEKFPDLLNKTKDKLGPLYQPTFPIIADNPTTDFTHGLSHIRSRSSHTNMGEAMLVPDHYYNLGIKYRNLTSLNKGKEVESCNTAPIENSHYKNIKIPYQNLILIDIRRVAIQAPYIKTYIDGLYKADFPKTNKISAQFHLKPLNTFEKRLSYNLVRTIYLDEKFKTLSSTQSSFINTPINISSTESFELAFTNEKEDNWILKLHEWVVSSNGAKKLAELYNSVNRKSDASKIFAAKTAKTYSKYYLPHLLSEL